jgi:hypothetical protein
MRSCALGPARLIGYDWGMAAKFPFTDLHSFKDYVGFVKTCASGKFPVRVSALPIDSGLAFEGLRLGLRMLQ